MMGSSQAAGKSQAVRSIVGLSPYCPMERAAEARETSEAGHVWGKVVLRVALDD
jgi:hypothetical protein